MEQLRQVGEALGAVHALMTFADDNLRINPRQCRLLADACALAFAAVAGEVRSQLRFDERSSAKWRPLESPLRELHRAVRDAEGFVRHCLVDPRETLWWARTAASTHGADLCVDAHMHNLLWSVAVVVEAVEVVAEAGGDPEETARRKVAFVKDYDRDMLDPRLFKQRLGARFLATPELAARMDVAWKEDRWLLVQHLEERRTCSSSSSSPEPPPLTTRHEHRLADVLTSPRGKIHPASILLQGGGGGEFQIRRRITGSLGLKEAQWMGEAFAVRHLVGVDNLDMVAAEVATLTSVAHPNVAHCRYCFHDEERREVFMVMDQLMAKDLASYVKEVTGAAKRRTPFPTLVVAVDVMLQIARGMEYLHSKKIFHGDLNPTNVLVKMRHHGGDSHMHVKVAGFGAAQPSSSSPGFISAAQSSSSASPRPSPRASSSNANVNGNANGNNVVNNNPCIWYAPEVLEEGSNHRCTEKADVYSFSMICFELLTGKIPFEDNHLQGEHMSKNIRAGERPLFPFQTPKYLTSLTKRCWHADPAQRPNFSSICRVLRYVKRHLVINPPPPPDQPDAATTTTPPPFDYLDIEANLLRRFPAWQGNAAPRVADVPFQMFAYRVMEKEKMRAVLHINNSNNRDKASDTSSDGNSLCGDDGTSSFGTVLTDPDSLSVSSRATSWSLPERNTSKKAASPRKATSRLAGPPQKSKSMGVVRPPQITARRTPRIKSDGQLNSPVLPSRRRASTGGHLSDSELP
ncbi:hypothetical protein QOZ80_5BG0409990 [Eleusine coracana subsp. coracana]|nr:hypothetical protein QOZ80_5BG0409990 [Eleusine coracana subsp. coracana]